MTPDFLQGAIKVGEPLAKTEKPIPSFLEGATQIGKQEPKQAQSFLQQAKEELTSPEETPFETGLGKVGRGALSVGLGFPGNIAQLTKKAGQGLYDFIQPLLGLPESPKEEGLRLLPTTSDVEKGIDVLTEGKYAPTEEERPYYEAAQDITSMFMPGSGPLKAWQRIAIPVAGQLTKEGIKLAGGGETAQELGKIGMTFATSLASIGNGEEYVSNLYNQAESLMPAGKMIDAKPIENVLNKVKMSTWFRGADLPTTGPARKLAKAIEQNIENGQIEGKMALELRRNANEIQKDLGAFDIYKKDDKKKAIALLNEVKDSIMSGIEHYGVTQDPLFGKAASEANKAYGVLAQSRIVKKFIEDHAPSLRSKTAKGLFHAGVAGADIAIGAIVSPMAAAGALASGGAAAAGAYGVTKTIQTIYRVVKDPKLRQYYVGVLEAAAKENAKAMAANMQKLDDALYAEENK